MISWEFSSMHSSHSCRRLGVTFFFAMTWHLATRFRFFFCHMMCRPLNWDIFFCPLHDMHVTHPSLVSYCWQIGCNVFFAMTWHLPTRFLFTHYKLRQETFFCPLQACHIPIADCMQHFCHLATWHVPIISCEIGFARKKSDMACDLNI